jgi:hypothetical protein
MPEAARAYRMHRYYRLSPSVESIYCLEGAGRAGGSGPPGRRYVILDAEIANMTELIENLPAPKTVADYKAAIDLLLNEMQRLEAQMHQDREEIHRLRAESEAITRHTDMLLARLEEQIAALGKAA